MRGGPAVRWPAEITLSDEWATSVQAGDSNPGWRQPTGLRGRSESSRTGRATHPHRSTAAPHPMAAATGDRSKVLVMRLSRSVRFWFRGGRQGWIDTAQDRLVRKADQRRPPGTASHQMLTPVARGILDISHEPSPVEAQQVIAGRPDGQPGSGGELGLCPPSPIAPGTLRCGFFLLCSGRSRCGV